jgi:membrane-bound lytic murein transglycosylase A
MKQLLAPISLLLLLTACGGDATKLTPVNYSALEGWQADSHAAAFKVFADSCAVNEKRSTAYQSKAEGPVGVRQNWTRVCSMAEADPQPSDSVARAFFEKNFSPYKVETESKATGTLTGYYEPIINGSRTKQGAYTTPVYGLPGNMKKPYYSREEIVGGVLNGKAPVLLYVDDPIMLFFLHIQGSGKVRLPDGSLVGLQYAGQNGHEFVPIGRVLKERGELPSPSMQGIRDWLRDHPSERDSVMNMNPSYIFFKLSPGGEMAKGALGIPLTPLRSVAVDDDRAAYGVPTYIDTYISDYPSNSQLQLQRLFVSQDTGGALKGPHRGDLFFGRGEKEEWQAGHQNSQGNVYWLLPVSEGVKLRDGMPLTEEELEAEKAKPIPAVSNTPAVVEDAPMAEPDTTLSGPDESFTIAPPESVESDELLAPDANFVQ